MRFRERPLGLAMSLVTFKNATFIKRYRWKGGFLGFMRKCQGCRCSSHWLKTFGNKGEEKQVVDLRRHCFKIFLSLSLVAKTCLTLATPWTVACQAPLSMGFSRREYWSGLPFPSPGDLPDPGIEPWSPALQADSLPTELWGKPYFKIRELNI